jgi:hypothetical protein
VKKISNNTIKRKKKPSGEAGFPAFGGKSPWGAARPKALLRFAQKRGFAHRLFSTPLLQNLPRFSIFPCRKKGDNKKTYPKDTKKKNLYKFMSESLYG